MNPQQIAQDWVNRCRQTICDYDHAGHMALISKEVQVLGVPGFDVIGYADWFTQCEYEFSEKLIADTRYSDLQLCKSNPKQIVFRTHETINTVDGTVDTHAIEVELTLEQDNRWRVTRERLLDSPQAPSPDRPA